MQTLAAAATIASLVKTGVAIAVAQQRDEHHRENQALKNRAVSQLERLPPKVSIDFPLSRRPEASSSTVEPALNSQPA